MDCPHLIDGCCDVHREVLGWRVAVDEGVCQRCEAAGGDPRQRKDIERRLIGSLKARILDAGRPVWEAHTGEAGLDKSAAKWLQMSGEKTEALTALLYEAVRDRGLDPEKASACMVSIEGRIEP